jgi:hypothetical protein
VLKTIEVDVEGDVLRSNTLLSNGAWKTSTDPRLAIALFKLNSKFTSFRINWMILRKLLVPQAGT